VRGEVTAVCIAERREVVDGSAAVAQRGSTGRSGPGIVADGPTRLPRVAHPGSWESVDDSCLSAKDSTMTVPQYDQDILWEPESPRDAVADAIASLRVDGLELDEFGVALMQRVADEEIDEDEAIAILLAQYRK
jgi:hypothetical protein